MNFPAKIIDGKLRVNSPDRFKQHLAQFKPDDLLVISVEKPTRPRSNQQNRYYWGGVLETISADTGYTPEELHYIFKQMFLPRRFIMLGGKEYESERSTKGLTTKEMSRYMEKIIIYSASELSIAIPTAEEYLNGDALQESR